MITAKNKILKLCTVFHLLSAVVIHNILPVGAEVIQPSYDSYSYDVWNHSIPAPPSYTLSRMSGTELIDGLPMGIPEDLAFDTEGALYALDSANGRIVQYNEDLIPVRTIAHFYYDSKEISIIGAKGIFVRDSLEGKRIYIANTLSEQIIECSESGIVSRLYTRPENELMPEGGVFQPIKVLVDDQGALFALVSGLYLGAVVFDEKGEFTGFYGSNKLEITSGLLADYLWKKLLSNVQKDKMRRYVPTEYLGFDIDRKNFIFTVTGKTEGSTDQIKRLNAKGINVLDSQMYGDLESAWINDRYIESTFIDIDAMENGNFSGLDSARGRVFIYDENGLLLSIFGGLGKTKDTLSNPAAIESYKENIYIADRGKRSILMFTPTEYGRLFLKATQLYNDGQYEECIDLWKAIIVRNGGNNTAYVSIGKAYMGQNDYQQAMIYFKKGYDRASYSEAFEQQRRLIVKNYFAIIFAIMLAAFLLLILGEKYLSSIRRYSPGKSTELNRLYRTPFHPVEGFEKIRMIKNKNSWITSASILIIWFFVSIMSRQSTGFIFNLNRIDRLDLREVFAGTILIFSCWVVSNWLISTMMDGKGRMVEIVAVSAFSLVPYIFTQAVNVALSNVITIHESSGISMISYAGIIWSIVVFVIGMGIIHEFSLKKVIFCLMCTMIGVLIMAFLAILAISLISQILLFVQTIWKEISFSI